MSAKPKVAFYWCAACGGCEETVVDLAEGVLDLAARVDIAFWPVALDFKLPDLVRLADQELDVTFLNGAIRTSEQEEMAVLLRRKSRVLVAFGACAQLGGVPGLANQFEAQDILRCVFEDAPTMAPGPRVQPGAAAAPEGLELPSFHASVRAVDEVVAVDYYIPGCPPTPKLTADALGLLLGDAPPPKGTVLAPDIALCQQCPRQASKPADLAIPCFHRPSEVVLDPTRCFLAQGVVCLGPATRGGCEAACPAGNMPCTGCFGPPSRVHDQGAKMLSALGGSLAAREPAEIDGAVATLPDPVGTLYRYGLAKSFLRGRARG